MKCKKILFSLIAILFMLPVLVSAKEYCTIVSGNGKDIGSEIDCAGEHFYIIDSDDTSVRMLAKYNLNTGSVYDKVTVSEERFTELRTTYCDNYEGFNSPSKRLSNNCNYSWDWNYRNMIDVEPEFANYRKYYLSSLLLEDNSFIVRSDSATGYEENVVKVSDERFDEILLNYCGSGNTTLDDCEYNDDYAFAQPEFADEDYIDHWDAEKKEFYVEKYVIKQDPRAIGAHGDKNNRDYPEYGVTDASSLVYYDREDIEAAYFDGHFVDGRFSSNYYEENYLGYLNSKGVNINKFDFITVKDLDDIFYKTTGEHLPLVEWTAKEWETAYSLLGTEYYIVGSIKDYLPTDMKWLYSTTYWTRTANNNPISVYFVDTLGDLCNAEYCNSSVGAGIRPVLTMARENIKYNIKTETDNNGTIEVVPDSPAGEEISFVLRSKEGYKLHSITLETESGLTVEFDQVSETEDGRIIVNTNKFIMPTENVKIIANWETEVIPEPEPEPEPTPSEPEEKDEVKEFNIKTIVDGDGSIDVIEKSVAGENIEFTIKTLNGSKLISLEIVSEDGKKVEYSKVREEDGSTTIVVNKFAMPESDITISAKFETVVPVPKTGDNIMRYVTVFAISFIILIALSILGIKNNKRKEI